jgi:hypothetical protein
LSASLSGEELYNYLENINAEDIKNIEVVSEPGAGQDARFQGGILKINLKPNNIQGIKGSSGFAYGFQDDANTTPLTSNLNVEYRRNKFSLYSGIRYRSNKFYQENNETIQYYTGNQRKMENLFDGLSTTRNRTGRLGMMYDLSAKQSIGMDMDLTATKNHSANITQSTIRTTDAVSEGYAQALSNQHQYRYMVSFKIRIF